MKHFSPDELVDFAEGALPESSAPHLESCDVCRQQLADLRAMMSAAAQVEVPEPSPLFWDHFSERVQRAVVLENAPRRASWREPSSWPRALMPLSAAAFVGVIIAAVLGTRPGVPPASPGASPSSQAPSVLERPLFEPLDASADPPLSLIADLTADIAWDAASRMELTTPAGGPDEAVGELTDGELRELQQLLKEELARPGV